MTKIVFIFFLLISIGCVGQDTLEIKEMGIEPKGIFSSSKSFNYNPSSKFLVMGSTNSDIILTTEPQIFHKKEEQLKDVNTHWNSEALNIDISTFEHDVFNLTIQILKGKYQMKFEWISDVLPEQQVIIESNYSHLELNSNKFIKGKTINGYLEFYAICKGSGYDKTKIQAKGNFKFIMP